MKRAAGFVLPNWPSGAGWGGAYASPPKRERQMSLSFEGASRSKYLREEPREIEKGLRE